MIPLGYYQLYEIVTPDGFIHKPPSGGLWNITEPKYRKFLKDNRIVFPLSGSRPRRKLFWSELKGLIPNTWWTAKEVGTAAQAKNKIKKFYLENEVPFSTPKPENLIKRILSIVTNPGDLILDPFAGSGTTGIVAQKMNRKWIMIEKEDNFCQLISRRFCKLYYDKKKDY